VGTGLTSERILRAFPVSTYTGIEYSENMLTGARKRLAPYDSTLICGDYTEGDLPTGNDLVVSVIGIHHQETDDDKKRLFGRIYDSLADEGHFVFGDLVTYRDPAEAALNEARHYHNLVTNVEDETLLREWAHHHKFLNCLAPLEDQVNWLREVGFRQVDVVYTKFNTALIHAVK
jgi:tRNA (cmo5U34)-methyltransferase